MILRRQAVLVGNRTKTFGIERGRMNADDFSRRRSNGSDEASASAIANVSVLTIFNLIRSIILS